MNEPIKHHYVPKFYLKGWVGKDKKVQYFYWLNNKLITKRISPKSTAFERELYSLKNVSNEEAQKIEKFLNTEIDDPASKVLNTLNNTGADNLSLQQRNDWAKFLIALRYRGPQSIQKIKQDGKNEFSKMIESTEEEYQSLRSEDDPPSFEEFVNIIYPGAKENFGLTTISNWFTNNPAIQTLSEMFWKVIPLNGENYSLLTSDNPLYMFSGLGDMRCLVALPLSPYSIFFATKNQKTIFNIDKLTKNKLIKRCNESMVENAFQKVYSKNDLQKNFIQKRFKKPT